MKKQNLIIIVCVVLVVAVAGFWFWSSVSSPEQTYGSGEEFVTYVQSEGIGSIAVLIDVPEEPRYPEGAPVVFDVSTWFAGLVGFHDKFDATKVGAINVNHLWPGKCDHHLDACSDGEDDYGGPVAMASLRDAIRFAVGQIPNTDGFYINELLEVEPLLDNVGLYASSHSGVVATNVMAYHGDEFPEIRYFIGRENPTIPEMYPLEIGHWGERRLPIHNPFYDPDGYGLDSIEVDYSTVGWIQNEEYPEGRPYHQVPGGEDYVLDDKGPNMLGRRFFSIGLTQAIWDNEGFTQETWPEDVATPQMTKDIWPYRTAATNYPLLTDTLSEDFKVMLVFSYDDHVQVAQDRPHIHQAFDGFAKTAGVDWVRLNPDLAYAQQLNTSAEASIFSDNDTNDEPEDWGSSRTWGHPYSVDTIEPMSLAGMAEMCDRVYFDDWSLNLDQVLWEY
jgi:hypothetical protein